MSLLNACSMMHAHELREAGIDYPTLLDLPVPRVRSYPPATVIAEKFQPTVTLGVLNGRMKDYDDLRAIPRPIRISDDDQDAAIHARIERRRMPIPKERPPGLSAEMFGEEAKQQQWRAYSASPEQDAVSRESVIDRVGSWSARRARGSRQSAIMKHELRIVDQDYINRIGDLKPGQAYPGG